MIILLALLTFDLFPNPPHEAIVAQMVIAHYRADTAFQREYDMADVHTVDVWMQGAYGEYECGDGVVRKGYPTRVQMDYLRGTTGKPCTYFVVFLFVPCGDEWQMFYAPRARFDDIYQSKAMRGI